MSISDRQIIHFTEAEELSFGRNELLIHRIFPFERFIDFVRHEQLSLVKPSVYWQDPYENPLNREIIESDTGRRLRIPHFDEGLFAQCWSLCEESDAMWRIYSSDRRGVLVTAHAHTLLRECKPQFESPLEQVYLGKVRYRSCEELRCMLESRDFLREVLRAPSYSPGSASVLLYKRDSFAHEQEVRLVLSRHVSEVPGDVAQIKVPVDRVVASVTLDPRISAEEFERMSYLIGKAGFAGSIKHSPLYAKPILAPAIPSLDWLYQTDH
ncbi:DUF2971 domain-containing protein [Agrilutibacter solisilvae]|uniref:DUF2971 domain-containing protein n=1 Tax=Agrilutibacter solisilvae TaxID=2763317 RepID=A0A975AU02_9GAMM|nr:DUF2971 domain-containing protein [Lysobacter solisilvae]QSX79570.1 hypothetical protein I8J32_006890 [Lysobacter solisilvae]